MHFLSFYPLSYKKVLFCKIKGKKPQAKGFIFSVTVDLPYSKSTQKKVLKRDTKEGTYNLSIVSNSNLISFQTSQAEANSGLHLQAARIMSPPSRARSRPSLRA